MKVWLRNLRQNEQSIAIAIAIREFCRDCKCKVYVRRIGNGPAVIKGMKHATKCDKKQLLLRRTL
jgi:hypothetical protein